MCTTNTTKCGAVNRAVLIGMERKSKSGERHVFIETTSEQVKLVYLWFHRFWENLWIYHKNYEKLGTIKHVPMYLIQIHITCILRYILSYDENHENEIF